MSTYGCCPHCGRKAKDAITSNYFPVFRCNECGRVHCKECGSSSCPKCGSPKRNEAGKVYAR